MQCLADETKLVTSFEINGFIKELNENKMVTQKYKSIKTFWIIIAFIYRQNFYVRKLKSKQNLIASTFAGHSKLKLKLSSYSQLYVETCRKSAGLESETQNHSINSQFQFS